MKVLMTQRALLNWGGTEIFTIEVANELSKRGHEVAVFCPRIGFPSTLMNPCGVWVKSRLSELPWEPDIVHGQHHLQAMAALSLFVGAPAIYYSHGVFPWPEQVPIHARIRQYVVMCDSMVPSLETIEGIPRERVTVIPNFVNTRRFSEVRKAPLRPAQALLYGGSGFAADELLMLQRACAEQRISLNKIGYAYGNPRERPEAFLPTFDVVFAIGRCALEALACGCAVIPMVPGHAGHLVTSDNFDDFAFSNFSPRYFTSGCQITAGWLAAELDSYSPAGVSEVTSRVRSTRTLSAAVDRLEQIYIDAINEHDKGLSQTKTEFAPYLEKLSSTIDINMDNQREIEWLRTEIAAKADYIRTLEEKIANSSIMKRALLDIRVSRLIIDRFLSHLRARR